MGQKGFNWLNVSRLVDIIIGTRPEAIKMAMVARKLKGCPQCQVRIVSTGQHREMLEHILSWFELEVDVDLDLMQRGQTLSSFTARCVHEMQRLYDSSGRPEIVLVQGDTTSAFVAALVAFYNGIKIGHVEAGLRTYNRRSPFPEEINRQFIGRLADFHFAPTKVAYDALNAEGTIGKIYVTGNPVIDALLYSKDKIIRDGHQSSIIRDIPDRKYKRLILITGHRRENFGEGFENICDAIYKLAIDLPNVLFVYPVHLNPNVHNIVHERLGETPNIRLIPPQSYPDFISLMLRSDMILTDSGGVQEEAPSLGKFVLVMRDNTERPEVLSSGLVKLVGTNKETIIRHVMEVMRRLDLEQYPAAGVNPFGDGTTSDQIAKIIVDECQ